MFEYFEIPKKYIGIYDGDTSQDEKQRIRSESRLIITNPYGLHYYLPYRNLWIRFLKNLKYVVIDECHTYRGVFGSNFAQVIRRLMRIMKSYQKTPLFILSSATIKNPKDLAEKLTGQTDFTIVDKDGSPKTGRFFVLWDLPMYEKTDVFKSAHTQTRAIFNYIVKNKLQTLCFTISRKMAELNAFYSKNQLKQIFETSQIKEDLSERIMSYRAGISPNDRRLIEKNLREKYYLGVYTTNALELGVDIGSLDVTILSGFPGTISSMWQQVGRSGRTYNPDSGIESLSFLIPMSDPLHLYYVRHHQELLTKPHETCNINLDNPYI
jgi:DEAD/DEAH box helicase domain-containing protein